MGAATAPQSEGLFGRDCGHDGSRFAPIHRPRSRQPLRRRRGCPLHWNLCAHLQAHEGEDLRW